MGFAVCAALAACSSDKMPDEPSKPAFEGDGYIAVQVMLPQTPSTRANDVFDDGEDYEYTVSSCDLILFKGTNEKDATTIGGFSLASEFTPDNPVNDNITSSSLATASVAGLSLADNEKLYGLVLINKPSSIVYSSKSLSVDGTDITKFSDLLSKTFTDKFYEKSESGYGKFFMTNAVLSTTQGGAADPTETPGIFTLANLSNALYATPEEAKSHPAGCIYVERAVAKVTAKSLVPNNIITLGNKDFTVKIEYALDNTENSSFLIRNVEGSSESESFKWNFANRNITDLASTDKYRMVGGTNMPALSGSLHSEAKNYYRTYWCVDPHYSTDLNPGTTEEYLARPTLTFVDIANGADANPLYCHENTFTVKNQTQDNTTRVVFKVTLTPKDASTPVDLYTINDETSVIYTSAEDAESSGIAEVLASKGVQDALTSAAKSGADATSVNAEDFVKVTYARNEDGIVSITAITLNTEATGYDSYFDTNSPGKFAGTAESYTDNKTAIDNLIESVNDKYIIKEYLGGVSFYSELIRHFDDDGCPLPTRWIGTTVGEVYKGTTAGTLSPEDYLGRYGMVRNNWYELSIKNIKGLGEPVIPKLKIDLSDDNDVDKKFIAVEVHTLSWAKRTHEYVFD